MLPSKNWFPKMSMKGMTTSELVMLTDSLFVTLKHFKNKASGKNEVRRDLEVRLNKLKKVLWNPTSAVTEFGTPENF